MNQDMKKAYLRFGAMIATSMVAMYALMYENTYEWSHVRWSESRLYMAFFMGAAMAVIMLSFMQKMLSNKKINIAIYLGSAVVFLAAVYLDRSQTLIDDTSYMSAMIPHHSVAILRSENADIRDMRVQELAVEIIEAQRREIAEMEWLIDDIDEHGVASTQAEAEARPVPEFDPEQ